MSHTRVVELIMLNAHSMDHQGRDTTLVTATKVAWIAGRQKIGWEDSGPLCPLQVPQQEVGGAEDGCTPTLPDSARASVTSRSGGS